MLQGPGCIFSKTLVKQCEIFIKKRVCVMLFSCVMFTSFHMNNVLLTIKKTSLEIDQQNNTLLFPIIIDVSNMPLFFFIKKGLPLRIIYKRAC